MSFSELGLIRPLLRNLEHEGYQTPTPIQAAAIPPLLAGSDLLGCAQTGTGKTAAFTLPLLQYLENRETQPPRRPGRIRSLILAPTRELAAQIAQSVTTYGRGLGLRTALVHGGVGFMPQIRAVRQGLDVLVATPGRLVDLMDRGEASLAGIEVLILDEADRMLDMGFLPALRRIVESTPRRRRTLMFSATMPDTIAGLAHQWLRDPVEVKIDPERPTVDRIEQCVHFASKSEKVAILIETLRTEHVVRAVVFTKTKHGADRLVKVLEQDGLLAEALHGDKSQSNRERTLARFRSSRPPILVATDLAARGIDVDDVTHVFNHDLPIDPETYVHRIGRTGRAGASGKAISFCDEHERPLLRAIEKFTRRKLPVASGDPGPAEPPRTRRSGGGNRPRPAGRPAAPRSRRNDSTENRPARGPAAAGQGRRGPARAGGRPAWGEFRWEAVGEAAPGSRENGRRPATRGPSTTAAREGHATAATANKRRPKRRRSPAGR